MSPVLFHLGPYPVYAFGAMLGLSLIVGYQLCIRYARRDGLSEDAVGNALLLGAVAGLLGARLAYMWADPDAFEDSGASFLDIQSGGMLGYGGIVAGFGVAALYLKFKGVSVLRFGDALAPGAAASIFFTRIGSYLYGSEFGTRLAEGSTGLLASLGTFPRWPDGAMRGAPALLWHIDRYGLPRDATQSYATHPVQLYDALGGVVLLLLCLRWLGKRAFPGEVLVLFALAFAALRFGSAYLRDDPDRGLAFGFSHTQLFCLLLAAIAAVGLSNLRKLSRQRAAEASGS